MIQKLIYSAFFSCLLVSKISAQTYNDFLQEKDAHKKAEIAYVLERQYDLGHKDSLQFIAFPLMALGQESKDPFVYAMGNHLFGSYLIHKGKFADAAVYIEKAKTFFLKKEDFLMLSELDCSLGNCFYHEGNFEKAVESYKSSIHYGQFSDRESDKINGFFGLGKAYCALGDTALGYLKVVEYRDVCRKQEAFVSSAVASAFLGELELSNGDFLMAKSYFLESIEAVSGHSSPGVVSSSYNNLAILKFYEGELDSSLYFFRKALTIREDANRYKGIVESYYNLAYYFEATGNIDSAYYYLEKQASFANQHKLLYSEIEALKELNRLKETHALVEKFNYSNKIAELENRYSKKQLKDSLELKSQEDLFASNEFVGVEDSYSNVKYFLIGIVLLLLFVYIFSVVRKA